MDQLIRSTRRVEEFIRMLQAASGPNVLIDRQVSDYFQWEAYVSLTVSIDCAKKLIKPYYQFGYRQHTDETWSAYCEWQGPGAIGGFVWANHRSEPIALCIAALMSWKKELEVADG